VFNLSSRLQYETLHEERGRGGRKLHVFMWTGISKITLSIYLAKSRRLGCRTSAKGMDSAAQREYRRLWSLQKGLLSVCIVNLTFTGYLQLKFAKRSYKRLHSESYIYRLKYIHLPTTTIYKAYCILWVRVIILLVEVIYWALALSLHNGTCRVRCIPIPRITEHKIGEDG